jgi:hypothetical protein
MDWCYRGDTAMSRPVAREDVPCQPPPNGLLQRLRHRCATFFLNRALLARKP